MSEPASHESDIKAQAFYAHWHETDFRFNDLDPLGHMTSLSFLNFFETARIMFVRSAGYPVDAPATGWMLVNLQADYYAQMHFPGRAHVGTRLTRLGRSSITTVQAMFQDGVCTANLVTSLVLVDRASDRSSPMPEGLRESLQKLSDTGAV